MLFRSEEELIQDQTQQQVQANTQAAAEVALAQQEVTPVRSDRATHQAIHKQAVKEAMDYPAQ